MMATAWRAGDWVGDYQLAELLGRGGSGVVFAATTRQTGQQVVLKLLRPERRSGAQRARLKKEGQALARLAHPGIVRLLHAGQLPSGESYLVLERAGGMPLRTLLRGRGTPLPLPVALGILAQVAAGLAHAHSRGVVHRDVKPENLMVRPERRAAGGLRVTLLDFGLAFLAPAAEGLVAAEGSQTPIETPAGALLGTPPYRAPEQGYTMSAALDAYAVGVLGVELLTGVTVSGAEGLALARQRLAERAEVPPELAGLLSRLLSPAAEQRPTMGVVAEQVLRLLGAGRQPGERKFAQRSWARHLSIRGVAILLTAIVGLAWTATQLRRPRPSLGSRPRPPEPSEPALLLLKQPIQGSIADSEVRQALPAGAQIAQTVEIAPLRRLGTDTAGFDWPALAAAQSAQVTHELLPLLQGPLPLRIAYFGFAPIPLAIQLGFQLSGLSAVDVYQRSHSSRDWRWSNRQRAQPVVIRGLPAAPSRASGAVVLRVGVSYPVRAELTREVVSSPLAEIDIALPEPDPDALQALADVDAVAAAVRRTLDAIYVSFPNVSAVHLFAAVPVGLALRLGTAISATVHPPIQTYDWDVRAQPHYRAALLLNTGQRAATAAQKPLENSMPAGPATIIEQRLERFVDWLKPAAETETTIRKQAEEIRQRIRDQATTDGLVVRSVPNSGSFAKNTGLRRHVTGGSAVDGQDVDLPFVLSPLPDSDRQLGRLLDRFAGYADRAYPQRSPTKRRTKSSIQLSFEGTKLSYDLVPMIAAPQYGDDYQLLLRGDGIERLTSVSRHIAFTKRRTDDSNQRAGRVKFNECVRLLKWWREFRMENDHHSIPGMPSILIDMLAAYAYDQQSVRATYSETLLSWFDFLYGVTSRRQRISFRDYPPPRGRSHAPPSTWMVIEPVDPENNLTKKWIDQHVDELGAWLKKGRDDMQQAVDLDRRGNHQESLHHLVRLFGTPFKNHCGS